jgi:hypothetical protein
MLDVMNRGRRWMTLDRTGGLLAADVICFHRGSTYPEERVANSFPEGVHLRGVMARRQAGG